MNKNMDNVYKMVRYSYNNVPLYMRIAEELGIDVDNVSDEELWKAIPVVDKSTFVNEDTACVSVKYLSKLYRGELINLYTSGSTGMYMNILWDKYDYRKSMTSLWLYRKKYYSIAPEDKLVFFYTLRKSGKTEMPYEYNKYSMGVSKSLLNMANISEVYMKIYEYKPKWMLLQPSVAWMLYVAKETYNLPDILSLEYIEFTGEYLTPEIRKKVIDTFDCKTANQYGCNEVNSIAYECPYGNMHCMTDNVYTSIEDGKIYITTLQNKAMPFVKYGLGDNITWDTTVTQCQCGCNTPVIKVNKGRECDYIKLKDGNVLSSSCIHRIFDMFNGYTEGMIKQYKVIQKDYDVFHVVIVSDEEDCVEQLKELLCDTLRDNVCFEVSVFFELRDVILPSEKTGKMKSFECEL